MGTSGLLEFVLGMIGFFFILSSLCSYINELIAGLLDWRTKELVKGIRDLLNLPMAHGSDDLHSDQPDRLAAHSLQTQETLGDRLLAHALIKGLSTVPFWLRRVILRRNEHQPSYIPARTFSLVMLDILAHAGCDAERVPPTNRIAMLNAVRTNLQTLPPQLQRAIEPLVGGTVDTLTQAQLNLEQWFNSKMDRISGAYKRWVQFILLLLAAAISIVLNADTLAVSRALWLSPTLRHVAAEQASRQVLPDSGVTAPSNAFAGIQAELADALVFPLGWGPSCTSQVDALGTSTDAANCTPRRDDWHGWIQKIVGLVATTLAVSLGAPFWFDLLTNVSRLRTSGPQPKVEDTYNMLQAPSS